MRLIDLSLSSLLFIYAKSSLQKQANSHNSMDTQDTMALESILQRLNGLAHTTASGSIPSLWLQMQTEFKEHPDHAGNDFGIWALANVHPQILSLATDQSLAGAISSIREDVRRRWKSLTAHFGTSLGVIVFLFGLEIASSRSTVDSLCSLIKLRPHLTLSALYADYRSQPRLVKGRTRCDLTLLRNAIAACEYFPGPFDFGCFPPPSSHSCHSSR